ncbi:MAG: DUF1893 domain-containing protein [Bacteroidales bacterium]|nr:DUF1893 domain-containing protein [Bacteroidales bacterium]
MQTLIDLLHAEGCSCVIRNGTEIRTFRQRGVADLYDLYTDDPTFMAGVDIADKVVGKGAAALMRLGGIRAVYADVISEPAADLLTEGGISVTFGQKVPHIVNRRGDGFCPLETVCLDVPFERIFPVIRQFVERLRKS